MLRKFEEIKDLGVFPNFKWESGLQQFEFFNLIYGWNGTGKTTLSRLLRYLENNEYLPEGWQPKFKILTDAGVGADTNPSFLLGSICVFNTDFVEDNIRWRDGRTNKISIGKASQELAEKLAIDRKSLNQKEEERLTTNQNLQSTEKSRDGFLTKRASEIKKRLTTGIADKYRTYNKNDFLNALSFIKSSKAQSSFMKLSAEEEKRLNAEIQQPAKDEVKLISLPQVIPQTLLDESSDILNKTPASSFIDILRKDSELNAWVKRGFDIHSERKEKECQFCLQTIPAERLGALDKHFSDEYAAFIAEIDRIGKSLKGFNEKYSEYLLVSAKDIDLEYQDEYSKTQQAFYKFKDEWKDLIEKALSELRKKRENPFENFKSTISEQIQKYEEGVLQCLDTVNLILEKHNDKSKNIGTIISQAKEKIEHSMVVSLIEEYSKLESDIESGKKKITKANHEISILKKEIENTAQSAIDTKIGESVVNKDLHRFLGRDDIELKDEEDGGYSIVRNGKKARYLSEGEKTAIALIYFFSKIREGKPLNEKTIVIDDPISSLDSQSTHFALSFIRDRVVDAKQVFLLTHNFYCLKEIKRWGRGSKGYKNYMIECRLEGSPVQRCSHITALDYLLDKYDSEYHYLFSKLYNWSETKTTASTLEEMYPLANMARKVLETFLSFKVPDHTKPREQMKHLNDVDETERNRLIRFLDVMSHSDSLDRLNEFPPNSVEEMESVISSLMKIIETTDKDHFKGMKSVIDAQKMSIKAKAAA